MRWRRTSWKRSFVKKTYNSNSTLFWIFFWLLLLMTDRQTGLSFDQKQNIIGQSFNLSWQWLKKRFFKMIVFCIWLLSISIVLVIIIYENKFISDWINNFIIFPISKYVSTEYTKTYFWILLWLLVSYVSYVLTIIIWKLTSDFKYELSPNLKFYLDDERSEKITIKDLIPDVKKFLRFSITFLIVLMISAVGMVFFVLPGLVLLNKFMFFGFRIIHRNEGIYRAITNLSDITAGFGIYILFPFLLVFLFIPSGILLVIIGIVFTFVFGFVYMFVSVGYLHRVLEVFYYYRNNKLEELQKLC